MALTGALAAALERFVTGLTLRHNGDPDVKGRFTQLHLRLASLQEKCVKLMDQDVKEYTRIIQTMRMSKCNEEEQNRREAARQEAKIAALDFPTTLIEYGLEMLHHSHMLIEEGYDAALADAAVAAEMAHATFWGALRIARANLAGVSDRDVVTQHQRLLKDAQTEAQALYQKIQERLDEVL